MKKEKKLKKKIIKDEKLLGEFFKSDIGKKISEKNISELQKQYKTKTGWFSEEEDASWEFIQ